ncbi:hypothetical protein FA10DRAFT_262325 [Acaromyces ingoldii]|uniref:Uncharacterized protein n=1 Tax=Acaromyces ingoldii TaxID=215250 RepID=A0A316YFI4_9BASI|nr:hypothetical protein FA10DRAFT_262325 [Acaromyces ingoldii]PWN87881.1 hypothetical protein FA10DRAFT_262325 [Acaromyces ingoldii]
MSTSTSSAASTASTLKMQKPDSMYASLSALLASGASSASEHLALLPPSSLSSSITHYLATLPTDEAAKFARSIASSPALWSGGDDRVKVLERARLVYEACARAVLGRIQAIVNERVGSVGWTSRRGLISWLRALADAVHLDADAIPKRFDEVPLPGLAIHTGLVAGLQAARAQRRREEGRGMSVGYALSRAEDEWCVALAECLEPLAAKRSSTQDETDEWELEFKKRMGAHPSSDEDRTEVATLFLAAQVAPLIPQKKLEALASEPLVGVMSDVVLGLFEESHLLDSIREDLVQGSDGLVGLRDAAKTVERSGMMTRHPLFSLLGPLSRMLSLSLSSVVRSLPSAGLHDILFAEDGENGPAMATRMKSIAGRWQSQWLSSRLSGLTEDQIAPDARPRTTEMWSVFKTMLFSFTMIFDALMEAVVDVCPSPTITTPIDASTPPQEGQKWPATSTSNIPLPLLEVTSTILITYSRLSWITSSFGSSTFEAYRRVFFEALDVIGRDGEASLALLDFIRPDAPGTLEANRARRAKATYYMDVVEQLIPSLSDEVIEGELLPICRPYLVDRASNEAANKDAFESAHSVLLSVFASSKRAVKDLAPFYARLLLDGFGAEKLNEGQLVHAYSTMVDAVSDIDDGLAWLVVDLLWTRIGQARMAQYAASSLVSAATAVEGGLSEEGRLGLARCFIAQLPNVNLVLLRSMLDRVRRLIVDAPAYGSVAKPPVVEEEQEQNKKKKKQAQDEGRSTGEETRRELCERTFDALGGLDASTREEGLRWWLDHRKEFGV